MIRSQGHIDHQVGADWLSFPEECRRPPPADSPVGTPSSVLDFQHKPAGKKNQPHCSPIRGYRKKKKLTSMNALMCKDLTPRIKVGLKMAPRSSSGTPFHTRLPQSNTSRALPRNFTEIECEPLRPPSTKPRMTHDLTVTDSAGRRVFQPCRRNRS